MDLHYDDHFCPSHDVVFAVMFENKALFTRLCSAVNGENITIVGEPYSQAAIRDRSVLLNSIRFDVMAYSDKMQMFTLDMQRRYFKGRQERRGVYYICRAVSKQEVVKMKYEKLHPVHIAFILTEDTNAQEGVRRVGLCYLDTGELYDDLVTLVLVSVPAVINKGDARKDDDLYVFSRFFAISSEAEAAVFTAEYATNDLAKELCSMYDNTVADKQNLTDIEENSYFTGRLTEAQLAEERAEAEARGEAKGKAEGIAEGEAKGKAEGIAEGIAEGKAEGIAEGEVRGKVDGANQMAALINKGYNVETALKMVVAELGESYSN